MSRAPPMLVLGVVGPDHRPHQRRVHHRPRRHLQQRCHTATISRDVPAGRRDSTSTCFFFICYSKQRHQSRRGLIVWHPFFMVGPKSLWRRESTNTCFFCFYYFKQCHHGRRGLIVRYPLMMVTGRGAVPEITSSPDLLGIEANFS